MNKALAQQIHHLNKQRHELTLERAKPQAQQEPMFDLPSAPPKVQKPRDTKHYCISTNARAKACQFCQVEIYSVEIEPDKWYPLEADPGKPGYGYNHWQTCLKRDEAKAYFEQKKRKQGRLK